MAYPNAAGGAVGRGAAAAAGGAGRGAAAGGSQALGSTNTIFITETRFDLSYALTPPGIIKAGLVVLNALCFTCVESSAFRANGRGVYGVLVALLGLAFSGALLAMYLFHVVEKYHNFKWLKVEMIGCAALTFLHLIAATMAVAFGNAAYSAAGFFGYLAMVLYGVEAFLTARALQAGRPAQGARVTAVPAPAPPAPHAPHAPHTPHKPHVTAPL